MTLSSRAVSIKQVPEKLDVKRGRLFFRELESCINVERPCIVLDCSRVREMDKYAVHLLLCCLEGAIKRNGDVRLAAVAPNALLNLGLAGLDRLFRIFETTDEAVESFQRRATHGPLQGAKSAGGRPSSANAA
jgi:anti-anti-sigma regulatory factor